VDRQLGGCAENSRRDMDVGLRCFSGSIAKKAAFTFEARFLRQAQDRLFGVPQDDNLRRTTIGSA